VRVPSACDLSEGIRVGPGATVTFHLTAPDTEFLEKLALTSAYILPAGTPVKGKGHRPVPGTGPYTIASYRRGHSLRLARNPYFHEWSQAAQPDGFPDTIAYRLKVKPDEAVDLITAGRADDFGGFKDPIPPRRVPELVLRYSGQTRVSALPSITALFLNTRMRPFDDVRVRRALNYAVDRRAVLRLLGGATSGAATCQILPPNIGGYRRYCPYHAPQLTRALALVRSSGTRGMRVTVWSDPESRPQARYARLLLRRLGYRATVRRPTVRSFPTSREPGKGAQVGTFYWVADYPAPSNFLNKLMTCAAFSRDPVHNLNPSQFCDPGIDALMRRATALQATDPQRANELWAEIDREVVDAAPWVPLTNPKSVEILSPRVGNYQFNPQVGSLLDQLWVR
jgi:peptide/nickel transport system substrate-binding protein